MENSKNQEDEAHFEIHIRPKRWSKEELSNVKAFIKTHQAKRTLAQKLRTRVLAIKYKLEEMEFNNRGMV